MTGWEVPAFYWIDQHLQSRMLDAFMIYVSNTKFWILPGMLALTALFVKKGNQSWFILITILLAVGLNDLICHQILKPLFARARPCQVLELPHVIYNCSGSFSLPSNHASNSFTIAMLIALMNRNAAPLAFLLAGLVAFSRVYLGVHYPTDVLLGALCGMIIGYLGFRFYQSGFLGFFKLPRRPVCSTTLKKS